MKNVITTLKTVKQSINKVFTTTEIIIVLGCYLIGSFGVIAVILFLWGFLTHVLQ